jgi:hypothetical protein
MSMLVDGLKVTWADGSTGVISDHRLERDTLRPDIFLASFQIEGSSRTVRGFLSVDGRMLRDPEGSDQVERALIDYCANARPLDGFLLRAHETSRKRGIAFVEVKARRAIC